MNPRFPIYIVSKGRWESRYTSRALEEMRVPYSIIVEEAERAQYGAVISTSKILTLDKQFQRDYDTCDDFGDSKPKGSGAARNFAWQHAESVCADFHWTIDDNIAGFERLNRNRKLKVADGTGFRCMEDFVLRYANVAMAGPNYQFFAKAKQKLPPFVANTRIYSCNLIKTSIPFRWRGRYNEDTILSLDLLKAGWCTIQFNAFLQRKMRTLSLKGGNTDTVYKDGTLPKSRMLCAVHPDVSTLVHKFKRWHHHVDYRRFKNNKLIRCAGAEIAAGINNYGMELKRNGN